MDSLRREAMAVSDEPTMSMPASTTGTGERPSCGNPAVAWSTPVSVVQDACGHGAA
jgi:hypothetical protein